ncbi:MAG: D-alanyl-D-alanine carboxypeptidase/D-alanyl-D-alanine-endopeptidase [Bacteroidales bacterium]|nr:D-alanyl-D-alanine carboxypeptidase/D-alanyl-D-alanine-endopeptidase [Bacteroidales bacterium]
MKLKFSYILLLLGIYLHGQLLDSIPYFLEQFNREVAPAKWGLVIKRLSDKKTFVSFHANDYFVPASIVKLLTTSAALHTLGESYVFRTLFYLQGNKEEGNVWRGDLIVIGQGDPTLGMKGVDTMLWADSLVICLKKMGIDSITGGVIGLASWFDSIIVPSGYATDDVGNYFGAGTASLVWNNGQIYLFFKTGKPGEKAVLWQTLPSLPGLNWSVSVISGKPGSGDRCKVFGYPFEWNRKIEGTLPPYRDTFVVRASSPDPALHAAYSIQELLKNKGIRFGSKHKGFYHYRHWQDTVFLFQVKSLPIYKIVELTNLYSNNVLSETLLKTLGKHALDNGSYDSGIKYLLIFIKDTLKIRWTGKITDGSGLSRTSQITPLEMTDFLVAVSEKKWFPFFYESLPIGGRTGTLKNYFVSSSLENNIRAKTGTMSGVRCLAGYFSSSNQVSYAFTLMINDYSKSMATLHKKIEQLLENIVKTISKYE